MALALGLVAATASAANAEGCSSADVVAHTCVISGIHGGHLTIGVHKRHTTPGASAPLPPTDPGGSVGAPTDPVVACPPIRPCEIGVIDPTKPGKGGVVTITDLKNFPPRAGRDHMQPDGWAVIGLDTNFYSSIGTELEHGKLLGKRADVQFTPIAWHWSYGDSHAAMLASPGASWATLGIQDFDPTPTSHVYETKGKYTIRLDITFSAEYRYAGGPWTAVIGTIDVPANPLTITAGDAKTVLVNHDCTQNPHGPGC